MALKSVSQHAFSMIPDVKLQRSVFNRSFTHKTCFDSDYLIPIMADIAVPGDTFNCKMTAFARLATPLFPIMDNMYLESFFFSIPIRLVWDNFQKFMGEQIDPGDSCDFIIPKMDKTVAPLSTTGDTLGSVSDYLGFPIGVVGNEYSCLWHRAYNLVYNEWFRDQNIIDSLPVGTHANRDDGPDHGSDYVLQKRGKRHDYFTSCLPWTQKSDGFAAYSSGVTLPLGTSAPVLGAAGYQDTLLKGSTTNPSKIVFASDHTVPGSTANLQVHATDGYMTNSTSNVVLSPNGTLYTDLSSLYADLSSATAASINAIRAAFQVQHWLERSARGGTRYVEQIRAHFNVVTPSQGWRTEYLGGGSSPVNIHPVANTTAIKAASAPGAADLYTGELAGFGTVAAHNHGFVKSFTEHCLVLGLVNVRADLTYSQGMNRMFNYSTIWDMYFPEFAHLGEQAVLNKEIWCDGTANDNLPFGYQERYAEMRYKPSQLTNLFRVDAAGSLSAWHLSQDFAALPVLTDPDFIESNTPIDRCIAVPSQPHFIFDSVFDYICVRPLPVYSVPGLMDHF